MFGSISIGAGSVTGFAVEGYALFIGAGGTPASTVASGSNLVTDGGDRLVSDAGDPIVTD